MANIRDYGAAGDGTADDTEAIQHALDDGDGAVEFPRGEFRITRTLLVDLDRIGRTAISGSGGVAKLVMDGPGPALFLRGTHAKSADPAGFQPGIWSRERMPIISGIEIEGRHRDADGVRIENVMQATLAGVLIRRVRTAVHVTNRARNLLISHCHLYDNTGIGVHFDACNLHQAIVTGSHISYCRRGGIRIENSEIRNFQITGNDIEYNNNRAHHEQFPDDDALPTAEIYVDTGTGSVREGTIASNTIQATYSPGGANIRFIGRSADENYKAGMWTISGNLIGSQENNVHLISTQGITLTGNYIYSGHHRNLLVENSRNVIVGSNCFGHNPDYGNNELCTGMRFVDCDACNLSGTLIEDCGAGRHTVPGAAPQQREGLVEFVRCDSMTLTGLQILNGSPYGILFDNCREILMSGCSVLDRGPQRRMKAAVKWTGRGERNFITGCRLARGSDGDVLHDGQAQLTGNFTDD